MTCEAHVQTFLIASKCVVFSIKYDEIPSAREVTA